MEYYLMFMLFVFGTIVGSFLNVVIYRLHTGRSLNGRSHCLSCGVTLSWYELFPAISYIVLRARCRHCDAHIPSRYFFVEILTGLMFAIVWNVFRSDLILVFLHFALVAALMVVAVYDIRHTIIPDELVLIILGVAVGILGYRFGAVDTQINIGAHILSGVAVAFFFWFLWFVSKGRWIGLGDAKLAFPLGMIVGTAGAFSVVVLSFWVGAFISLSLIAVQHLLKKGKRYVSFLLTPITIKSEVPFAPFLILGFLLVHIFHVDVFTLIYKVLG